MNAFVGWLIISVAAFLVAHNYPVSGEYSGLGRLGLYGVAAVVALIAFIAASVIALIG